MENQLKRGDIVTFYTPYPGEGGSRFIIQEVHYDLDRPKAKIAMFDSGL